MPRARRHRRHRRASSGAYFPYPRAGKTGTTENGWDVWYCGYTPQLAAAVWMGDAEKNSPMDGAYGGTYCAPMWSKFFAAALKDEPHPGFKTYPWSFGDWKSEFSVGPSASASSSGSPSASPSPGPTKTITPDPQPTTPKPKPTTPKPTPTTPKPTPTTPKPTGTPTAAPRQVIQALTTPFDRSLQVVVADAQTSAGGRTGAGDTGLAGAAARWVAGLLGL